ALDVRDGDILPDDGRDDVLAVEDRVLELVEIDDVTRVIRERDKLCKCVLLVARVDKRDTFARNVVLQIYHDWVEFSEYCRFLQGRGPKGPSHQRRSAHSIPSPSGT